MTSYAEIHNRLDVHGDDELRAIVVVDGDDTVVLGPPRLASAAERMLRALPDDLDETRTLAALTRSITYFDVIGPILYDGSLSDAVDELNSRVSAPAI